MALPTREDFQALLEELKDMNRKVGRLVELHETEEAE